MSAKKAAQKKPSKGTRRWTAKATSPAASGTNFTIQITIENGEFCVPRNIPAEMHPGDTVTYQSPNGMAKISFNKNTGPHPGTSVIHTSPYVDPNNGQDLPVVQAGVLLHVQNIGDYFGKCSLKDIATGELIKWTARKKEKGSESVAATQKESDYESGGNHVVR
jgi:hypothetical protein